MNDSDNIKVVENDVNAKNGQSKCPKCGATDISLNSKNGKLRCNFCRYEFEPEKAGELGYNDITELKGEIIGSGATDIDKQADNMVTLKCSSCGAEVVIDTSETTSARCHWCRNTLSINQKVPNGAVPDVVLPFGFDKKEAKELIEKFVRKRRFFAHPDFKKEFCSDNVMGMYLPYMVIDTNAHAHFEGQGEHLTKEYTRGSGDDKETFYDADLYDIERDFDLTIDDLTIESSADKLDTSNSSKTNDIINSIMPFDTENAVKWDANYLKGYTSEKRDTNIEELKETVQEQEKDIARFAANESLEFYDRGVKWDKQTLDVKGRSWKNAYLPVWLYSYQQKKKKKNLLHYVAVNARTKETMGSIPIHFPKLFFISALIETFSIPVKIFLDEASDEAGATWIVLTSGFIYALIMYGRYRNKGVRHYHEVETKHTILNLSKKDKFVKQLKKLKESTMVGANNREVKG